jgi:hypothetical protein
MGRPRTRLSRGDLCAGDGDITLTRVRRFDWTEVLSHVDSRGIELLLHVPAYFFFFACGKSMAKTSMSVKPRTKRTFDGHHGPQGTGVVFPSSRCAGQIPYLFLLTESGQLGAAWVRAEF